MNPSITVGFPRMMKEAGEKRVFLPEFVEYLTTLGAEAYLSEGYGSRLGLTYEDYKGANVKVHRCSQQEALTKDIVIVLRSPTKEDFASIPPGTVLISMLHYPTRPERVQRLKEQGIKAISLDSIVNDSNLRLVEDMKAVAWNGLEVAFDMLEKRFSGLNRSDGQPYQALILGTGMVGKHAVDAATKLGNIERNNDHIAAGGCGSLALVAGRNLSGQPEQMEKLFRNCDILVDSTQRRDPSLPTVPNKWIAWLPEHAIVVDLSVDPYTLDTEPPVVRGIEGIPQGNLDQYIFHPDDPHWCDNIPPSISCENRRTTVSCYSWPGIHPEASMLHYGQQLKPLMEILLKKGYDRLSLEGDYFERALYRACLKAW
ncbi:MAG TPA: hypothetical protein VLS48_02495 [Anaerolineales bacterium]|nr:hypothetical protein [Anaerolineales bacterium]